MPGGFDARCQGGSTASGPFLFQGACADGGRGFFSRWRMGKTLRAICSQGLFRVIGSVSHGIASVAVTRAEDRLREPYGQAAV
ncbi:hypothetical protein PGA1_c11440 [Phaeobacter inhibens DSM 17395]|nr:hypothetical protein PGA1_c11440 [Phaeobacter inhibens DSM 17395]